MAAATTLQRIVKTLKEPDSVDSKILALTSLRRTYLEDQKNMKALIDEDFCELCKSVINASVTEDDKLHIEVCRTLDIILPETKNKNFDFFQSILQINRKKRLKILVSLSLLKDETVATIASKLSILDFLNDCLQSIQPKTMIWLLPENSENVALLKSLENMALSENEDFEEKVADRALQLLRRLYSLSSLGLNIQQFDVFIMDEVIQLAYMGHHRQRAQALLVLQEAVKNDLGIRIRSIQRETWDKYKAMLQSIYCKRMTLLVNICDKDWATLWETSITLIGTDLHRGSGLVNSLLKVEELAFKSADPNRRQAFLSWKLLIDNFALDQRELATSRRIKLLCVPLNAKNSKTEVMVLTKLEVWWHLIYKVYPSIAECIDTVLIPFLSMCFGPFGDKPLFIQKTDTNVSLGKKFPKTQIFAIDAFLQLMVNKADVSNLSISGIAEKLPSPVRSSIFENMHKIFIHCFGEIILTLGLLSDEDVKNKKDICKVLWDSLIKRIEEYDKMKVPMYKEVISVVIELIKNRFHKMALIRDFLLNVVLKSFDKIVCLMNFPENILMDLIQTFLQVENFPCFTMEHYNSIDLLLWQLIKPKNSNVYYPQTLELMQTILQLLDNARKINVNVSAVTEVWCILAKIAKKYIEDSQNINEGTAIGHNFKTMENIIAFPYTNMSIDDPIQLKKMAETWKELYEQFDFQAELIVSVKPNSILNETSNMIIAALKKDKKCCDFATICIDGLLSAVNYDHLPDGKETPEFIELLKDLTFQCLRSKSFVREKILKAISSFLLRVFSHSMEKTATYLKILEPTIKYMLAKIDDPSIEREVSNTWSTVVGIFKKLDKSLIYELLTCYQKTMVLAMLHLNKDISSIAFSILDLKDYLDERSKKVSEAIMNELKEASIKNNFDVAEIKEKSKKMKSMHKPIGSFLNRKTMSPSNTTSIVQNGKENLEKTKVINIEPDSQDFVVINTDIKLDVNYLTDHQKEMLKKRRDDIPAMYNELSISNLQDSQELQRCFDIKIGKLPDIQKNETLTNNNEPKTSTSFKNITKTLSKEIQQTAKKPTFADAKTSPKARPKKLEEDNVEGSTVEDSQKQDEVEVTPIVAKKLDFESRDEFPADPEQISPSILDSAKMKRRIHDDSNGTGTAQNKAARNRRSLQSARGTIRKFNSTEQLNKRGKKRRNSESNSEGMLDIEREKRPKPDNASEGLNSNESKSEDKSNEDNKTVDNDGKKISKRQMNEMSRLKIDMRFEPLPSRRSIGKSSEATTADKKTASTKDEKTKEDKSTAKSDTSNPQQNVPSKRRSMKAYTAVAITKADSVEKETQIQKKDNGNKKAENSETINKAIARKLVTGKTEASVAKKKNELPQETQEEIIIEDASTPMECEAVNENLAVKDAHMENEESAAMDMKSSQDSDIVESSQEPTATSKLDKVECFIKIKKMEMMQQASKVVEQASEKDEKVIEETPADLDETSMSVAPVSEPEKVPSEQPGTKKVDSNSNKPPIPVTLISSPKSANSRIFRSKAFPLQGRAAQMLGLVTKQSIAEKLAAEASKADSTSNEEVPVIPAPKKDKTPKECDRVSSPSSGSRQEKMFSNMNNNMRLEELASSPSMSMFCNLRNDGERISPKLDRHERDSESSSDVNDKEALQNGGGGQDDSPNKSRKELPLLEWSNANPPSLTASPSASILKRMQEVDIETPNSRKKRVSFADPPVSREMGYEIMTDSCSSPKLEKLPTIRSPSSRKETKKHTKLRLIQIDQEKLEKENDVAPLNNAEEKPVEMVVLNETINISSNSVTSVIPKVKLTTVISEFSQNELKIDEIENNVIKHTQDVDMFAEGNNASANDESIDIVKTSTQNDQNNSSIKLESINLSNILHKSDNNQNSLDDTMDVGNISSSLEGTVNTSNKPARTASQQSAEAAEAGDTLPVTDSIFSNLPLSQETQSNVAQLIEPENFDSTLPVYPSLISCDDAIEQISAELVDPLFTNHLTKHLSIKSIRSVGDLAQLTERDINRLPIKSPKIPCVKNALSRYEEKVVAKTPDRRTSSVVSSSTPLGNKRRDKNAAMNDSFEDLMKSNSNSCDLASINVSAVYESRRPRKRVSMDCSVQTSPAKKLKKIDQEVCTELMDQCDDAFLFEAFVKKFDAQKILKGYREKMSNKSEKDLKKETLNMLGLSIEDDSEASFNASTKTAGLQKVLQQLPKLFDSDDKFINTVLKTYKKQLNATNVLDVLKPSEVKKAVTDKFSSTELLNILAKRLSQEKEKGVNESIPDTNDLQELLDRVSSDAIVNVIKRRMN